MSARPPQIVSVTAGKSLGAAIHKGWAATWNWMLSWVNHFTAGNGCTLENAETGHPRLDVLITPGEGIEVSGGGKGQAYVISATGGGGSGDGDSTSLTGDDETNNDQVSGALTIQGETFSGGEKNITVQTIAGSDGGGTVVIAVRYV